MSAYRIGVQQRVLPGYRAPFFDALAEACAGGLSVFAGQPRPGEAIEATDRLQSAQVAPARNLHLLRGALSLYWQAGLRAWLEDWQPQVLITETNPRNGSLSGGIAWMHARSRPVIGWGLGAPALRGPLAGVRDAARRGSLRRFDALLAYSRRGAEEYRASGFPERKIFVAPNAATRRPAQAPPPRPEGFRGRPVVLFVGRLQARKRIDNLLRACAALPADLQPRLTIVGDGPARAEFEELAARIYPRVEFAGARQGAALEPFFAAADLFVLPGTGGLALQQAMSYGLPVIAAEADGTQADLVRAENGWRVAPGSQAELTHALGEALSDARRLRAMGAASFRLVSEEVNVDEMVRAFLQAIETALAGAGG